MHPKFVKPPAVETLGFNKRFKNMNLDFYLKIRWLDFDSTEGRSRVQNIELDLIFKNFLKNKWVTVFSPK